MEIYALVDPRDGATRYIGKARNARKRLKGHLREKRRKFPLYFWIGELVSLGLRPAIVILAQCDDASWKQTECEQIARERAINPRLLNVADGGDEPECPVHVRAANGRRNAQARVATPLKARVWALKRRVGDAIYRRGAPTEKLKAAMRYGAQKRPDLFGEWAGV